MTQLAIVNCLIDPALPGAMFADAASVDEFAAERRVYDAAVAAYAKGAAPAAIDAAVAFARRYGVRMTRADAKEAAVSNLRADLTALGFGEDDVQWHAARRGRRNREIYFANARLYGQRIVEAPEKGGWRGPYHVRRCRH